MPWVSQHSTEKATAAATTALASEDPHGTTATAAPPAALNIMPDRLTGNTGGRRGTGRPAARRREREKEREGTRPGRQIDGER